MTTRAPWLRVPVPFGTDGTVCELNQTHLHQSLHCWWHISLSWRVLVCTGVKQNQLFSSTIWAALLFVRPLATASFASISTKPPWSLMLERAKQDWTTADHRRNLMLLACFDNRR